jgi:hypothetical protein
VFDIKTPSIQHSAHQGDFMSWIGNSAQKKRATATYCLLAATSLGLHVSAALAWETISGDAMALATTTRSATLSWTPPTRNTNGTVLTNLAGYKIYTGTTRTNLKWRATVKNPGLSRYVVEPLVVGERYFAIAALNTKGVMSARTGIVDVGAVY